jgi:hypothetical protein
MAERRQDVLIFGADTDPQLVAELTNRQLVAKAVTASPSEAEIKSTCAAVFWFPARGCSAMIQILETDASKLVDYGIRLELIAPDDLTMSRLQDGLGPLLRLPNVHVRTAPSIPALAEGIARHGAGEEPRTDLKIIVAHKREPIRTADAPLFQRAFPQCPKITLVELTGGLSDARVFAVHMVVDKSNAGIWPQPAFVKLDQNDKIEKEFQNYKAFADRFIPFGLRPNIQSMIVGSGRSLLVGDFVDRSESLWTLVQRNVASHAITALVDETLGGWRQQGYAENVERGAVSVVMKKAGISSPDRIKHCYVERAADFGVTIAPLALFDRLDRLDQAYRLAPIHGDLHGDNVRVKAGQAILIDLASVSRGPLTADLAALDTWFAFQVPPGTDCERFEDEEWAAEIDRLYASTAFQHPPGPCDPASPLCWMANVVRQIRTMGIASQSCPMEYQTAVALQLLRRCQWDDGPAADRYRRGYGYRIAVALAEDVIVRSEAS